MTKALIKNTFREIANTKARFFSIMAIIALGVGFFAGIMATVPSMYNLGENYFREKNLMDFRLISTVGFAEEDIAAVAALDGVEAVMPSYFCDVLTSTDDGGSVIRVIAAPKPYENNKTLNTLTINEGRTIRKSGEIITESVAFANIRRKIGAKISFDPIAGDNKLSDLLKTNDFTVVGKTESPLFISYQRGTTTIGDGKIDEYMYISADDFNIPRYTELYVKAKFSDEVSAFSEEYEAKVEKMEEELEKLSHEREKAFSTEVIPKAKKDLADGKKEFEKQKANAEQKLNEALEQINAGEEEYNSKIAEAEEKLNSAEEQIKSGEEALEAGEVQYAEGISEAQALLTQGVQQLEQARQVFSESKAAFEATLKESESDDPYAKIEHDTMDAIGSAQLGAAQSELVSGDAKLAIGSSELAVQQINGQLTLSAARTQLSTAKTQLESGRAEFEKQKESGEEELKSAREEFNKAKAEADEKISEGKKELEDAEKALEAVEGKTAEWYVFDRSDNPGYSTYSQNVERLNAVAKVFPVFFLLVAVLVCVTTMTRLIEEKRTEIATLTALGYGKGSVVLKYVIYSMIAAVAGSFIGVWLGVLTLPAIIYNAYKIMFYIGDITLILHAPSIVLGTLSAVVCTTAVSVIVCVRSLRTKPAQAMRPKAPKPGKRILLERITPLWKHMSFTAKLTARNLFRYKARLCMTVIGVAGCTALIVAAFGLRNSFDPLTKTQFNEIFKYDAAVIPRKSGSAEDLKYIKTLAESTGKLSASMPVLQEEVTVGFNGHETKESTYISVPGDIENFENLISLHTRIGKQPLTLNDDSVMINERLASDFGFSAGDTVTLTNGNVSAEIKVGGIYENYIHNYVFMTPECYKTLFGYEPLYNMYEVRLTDKSEETNSAFSTAMLADDRITAVAFTEQNVKDFRNMLNSLNMVIVVMVVCAAALAFVVLYNLTNINIAERQREIATFKVLGFFNRETSRFIYIENIVLTILGIAVGLVLGIFLAEFIITTVEVDNVMFGREIYPSTFLYASGLTLIFSLLVNAAMNFKIKSVNMVESLKSVE